MVKLEARINEEKPATKGATNAAIYKYTTYRGDALCRKQAAMPRLVLAFHTELGGARR